jgi:hypothetical protein
VISDNGQGGICGIGHFGIRIIGNTLERNNRLGFSRYEEAAIKLHNAFNTHIEANIIRDNETTGIWIDAVWRDIRITRNLIVSNRGYGGIFAELGRGPCLVDNNILGLCRPGGHETSGFYSHDAEGVTLAHNLFIQNPHYGAFINRATNRAYGDPLPGIRQIPKNDQWVNERPNDVREMRVVNNLFINNARAGLNFPGMGPAEKNNTSDYNIYSPGGVSQVMMVTNGSAGGTSTLADVQAALEKVLADKVADPRQMPRLLPYHGGPLLTFEQWQLLTRQDLNSATWRLRTVMLNPRTEAFLRLAVPNDAKVALGGPSVPGVERDFHGRPMPKDKPLPGPFQDLREGQNIFRLRPIADPPAASSESHALQTPDVAAQPR